MIKDDINVTMQPEGYNRIQICSISKECVIYAISVGTIRLSQNQIGDMIVHKLHVNIFYCTYHSSNITTNTIYESMTQIINENKYIHPEVLVDTQWVEEHLDDKNVRIAEVDYDAKANYDLGHVPGSVLIAWKEDINDPLTRNILTLHEYLQLLQRIGVNNDTTLVLYGDFNNWFAAFAFWVFKYYRYKDVRLLNGGRKKWLQEDRPITKNIPQYPPGNYRVLADESSYEPDNSIRVFLDETKNALVSRRKFQIGLVDVRSPKEFTGEILAPPEYPTEHAQRGGHIPSAINIPWAQVVNDSDGTFKSIEQLKQLYESNGITKDKEIITYCRIGERSSHTWLVLKYLLGYPDVKNYDGSWTEWGNMIANPIEK